MQDKLFRIIQLIESNRDKIQDKLSKRRIYDALMEIVQLASKEHFACLQTFINGVDTGIECIYAFETLHITIKSFNPPTINIDLYKDMKLVGKIVIEPTQWGAYHKLANYYRTSGRTFAIKHGLPVKCPICKQLVENYQEHIRQHYIKLNEGKT